jgi:hypothetical protein
VLVDALESEIKDQVVQARAALEQARAEQDEFLVHIHEAELDGLARTADAHGLRLEPEADVVDLTALDVQALDVQAVDEPARAEEARSA